MILNLLRGQVSCLVSLNSNMRWYKQVVEVTPAAVAPNLLSQKTFPTGLPHKQLCILFCHSLSFGLISHLLFITWPCIYTNMHTITLRYSITITKLSYATKSAFLKQHKVIFSQKTPDTGNNGAAVH